MFDENFEDEEVQVFTKSEWQPNSPFGEFVKKLLKILKKLPKYIFFALIIVVWAVIFAVLSFRSNDDIVETPILSENARAVYSSSPDGFELYEIHTSDYMNSDGTIQLIKSVYADTARELEVGLRIKGHLGETLFCRITDEYGNIYGEIYRNSRERDITVTDGIKFQYVFERISFGNVYIDVSENIINRDTEFDISGEISRFASEIEDYSSYIAGDDDDFGLTERKNTLYFEIYTSSSCENLLFKCVIYDNDTPLEAITYRMPDEEYLK